MLFLYSCEFFKKIFKNQITVDGEQSYSQDGDVMKMFFNAFVALIFALENLISPWPNSRKYLSFGTSDCPFSSSRQHLSCDSHLEVRGKIIRPFYVVSCTEVISALR